ncbi:MAG: tetratricopeptide repeat protein, partial [Chloroflexota bacterium]
MMNAQTFTTELLAQSDLQSVGIWLDQMQHLWGNTIYADEVIELLRQDAYQKLYSDLEASRQTANVMFLFADYTKEPTHRALALRTRANAYYVGDGNYRAALSDFDDAHTIYHEQNNELGCALVAIGRCIVMFYLGQTDAAFEQGIWAQGILIAYQQSERAAAISTNIGTMYDKLWDSPKALQYWEEALDLCPKNNRQLYAQILLNQSLALRNLGQFETAIQCAEDAYEIFLQLNKTASANRSQQSIAVSYLVKGRYNEAFDILTKVKEVWIKDQRWYDTIYVDLYMLDALLKIYRYQEVIDRSGYIEQQFRELGVHVEAALILLTKARAHIGLAQYVEAENSLKLAKERFSTHGNQLAVKRINLELASILVMQTHWDDARKLVQDGLDYFSEHKFFADETYARLLLYQIALDTDNHALAQSHIDHAFARAIQMGNPQLLYRCHYAQGILLSRMSQNVNALAAYQEAVAQINYLQNGLMIDHRIEFIAHHYEIYTQIVELCLQLNRFDDALTYVEQAKSRTLLDLLSHRIDLQIEAKKADDQALIENLR